MRNYVALIRKTDHPRALIPLRGGRPVGTSLLAPKVEDVIKNAIERIYLVRNQPPLSEVVNEIQAICRTTGLCPPSLKAVRLRVDRLGAYEVLKKRKGPKKAKYTLTPMPGSTKAEAPMELIEIDHTSADVILVSDTAERSVLGRPWVTLAIDVATRMVVGVYVTFDAPSATSVALCMMNVLCDKAPFLAWIRVEGDWPAHGIPSTIYVDNGKDFHSNALERGCQAVGSSLQYRPVGSPHYGGIIERLIGTMMGKCKLLPGSTQSNVVARGDSDPEKCAVMTLAEFRHWFVNEIVTQYHLSVHRTLGVPPLLAWREMIRTHEPPRTLASTWDIAELFITFLPAERRLIRRDGVRLNNLRYWHEALSPWVGDEALHLIHYDPRDISKVYVRAPSGLVVCAQCISEELPGVSRAEWQAHRSHLKHLSSDPAVIAHKDRGVLARREMIEASERATSKARRAQARRQQSLALTPPMSKPLPGPTKPVGIPDLAALPSPARRAVLIEYDAELWS
ncbi:MAG: transposase [Luteibacter sp.]